MVEDRFLGLMAAENRALLLLNAVEESNLIRPGLTEREVEHEIFALARSKFGVLQHWHKRIVRAGANTLAIFADNPPDRLIGTDDLVFVDLGPVLDNWEADVGQTYALGNDPRKKALVAELPKQFALINDKLRAEPNITGAALFAYACDCAAQAGWKFGGKIAGHVVAEFPHARWPGERQIHHISPENPVSLSAVDPLGQGRHWIIEVHLVCETGGFGGFYKRLALRPRNSP